MKVLVDQVELNFPDRFILSDDEFFDFASQMNNNLIKRDEHGNIFIMTSEANETSGYEKHLELTENLRICP
jgi:hypothetical protein